VVGVGASAGGLDAFTRMLRVLPSSPGFALVFVQHL
jgi:two-component system CheB/CheR fusion protein